jgi:hypothetical protein
MVGLDASRIHVCVSLCRGMIELDEVMVGVDNGRYGVVL